MESSLNKTIEFDLTNIISSLSKEKQKKFLKKIKSEAIYERILEDLEVLRVEELMKLLNAINYRLQELANNENRSTISLLGDNKLSDETKSSSSNNDNDNEEFGNSISSIVDLNFDLPKVSTNVKKQLLIVLELFDCSVKEYCKIKDYILQTLNNEKYDVMVCCEEFMTNEEKTKFKKTVDLCIYININIQVNFDNCIKGTKEIKYYSDVHLENLKENCESKRYAYLIVCPKNIWSLHLKQEINSMRRDVLPLYSAHLGENNINLLTNSITTILNDLQ